MRDEGAASRPGEAEGATPQPPRSSFLLLPHHLLLNSNLQEVPVLSSGQMLQVRQDLEPNRRLVGLCPRRSCVF